MSPLRLSPVRVVAFGLSCSAGLAWSHVTLAAAGDVTPSEPAAAAAPAGAPASSASATAAVAEVQALADAGRFPEAEKKARAALAKNEDSAELHNLLGFSLRKQKKYMASVASYREAIKLKPDFAQAKEYLAISYLHTKEYKSARALHSELKTTNPDLARMVEAEAKRLKAKW